MKQKQIYKLALAGILIALGVACAPFSIPIGASKCAPVQHMINVLAGVLLGPWYACGMAFITSCIRIGLGAGTLMAFPGSMVGALCCGLVYRYCPKLWAAYIGEVAGTGILGAMAAYPVATLLMGKEAALFTYVVPFLISTGVGAMISVLILTALERTQVLAGVQHKLS